MAASPLRVVSERSPAPLRAAVYVRISEDRERDRLGVQRQETDCREFVEHRGWTLARVYEDNDLSAYSGKPRPAYRQLVEDIRSGVINAVVAWHPDRLHRSPLELEEFIAVVEQAGTRVETVKAGQLDLSTPSGRAFARNLGTWARYESEHKAERQRRKHQELADAGKDVGAGRPFGYEEDRRTVRKEEAELIRDAARRVLQGESIRGICRDWNDRGIRSAKGGEWRQVVMRRMLAGARISGRREFRRKAGGTAEMGVITSDTAEWPGIISPEESDRLRRLLGDPERRTNTSWGKYLLTGGLARCGVCGQALVARPRADKRRSLVCASGPGFKGCGGIRVLAEPLEILVVETVLQAVEQGALATVLSQRDDRQLSEELLKVEAKLAELMDDYTDDRITRQEWKRARGRLVPRQEQIRRQLMAQRHVHNLDDLPEPLRAGWPDLPLHRQRAIVGAIVRLPVIVNRAVWGRNFFDPDRVVIKFFDDEVEA